MGLQERKAIIEAPIKAILTEAGTTFFIANNKTLRKFKLPGQKEEYGFLLEHFSPASLQRMILLNYISRIEISIKEYVSLRQEIMDISKLLTYSMLYQQYDAFVFQCILSSEVVKNWNRKNPGSTIDETISIHESLLGTMLLDKEKKIAQTKQAILSPVHTYISKNSKLMSDEKNIQLLLSEKFLNNILPLTWNVMIKFRDADGYETLVKEIRTGLMEYMEKSRIAEYIALNVFEIAANAENLNLKGEAKTLFKGEVDMNAVLFDTRIRKLVQDSLQQKGEIVSIAWELGSRSAPMGSQGRLQVTIYNRESAYNTIRNSANDTVNHTPPKSSLMEFYKKLASGESNTELGLYYLSYLSEACDKVHVKMDALVSQIPESDLTTYTLGLNL